MQHDSKSIGGVRLCDVLPDSRFFGGADVRISSCCRDSRSCQPGDLFAALAGDRRDGHDFAIEAVDRGAAAVLAERPLPLSVPTCIVDDTRVAYGRICQALTGHPSQQLKNIAVSGTHGKTVTTMLMASALEASRHVVGIMSSLGYCDNERAIRSERTTPPSCQMAHWMSRMVANGCTHAVLEASSHGLSRKHLSGIELDAAIMTNVRRGHLDEHGSLRAYRDVKRSLFNHLKPDGFMIVNADDPATRHILARATHPVLTYGMQSEAEVTGQMIERHSSEQTFLLSAGSDTIPVRTTMIGVHHVYNCLAVTAAGLAMGLDLPTIVKGLESLNQVPGRMERVSCDQEFSTFVDSGTTPDSLGIALKTLRPVTERRLICVYGAEGECQKQQRAGLGRVVEQYADVGIITNLDPRDEEPLQIAHDILDGYDRPSQAHLMPDRARAIGWALMNARRGDTVLIAGKGNRTLQIVKNEDIEFDDRAVARYFLEEMNQSHKKSSAA